MWYVDAIEMSVIVRLGLRCNDIRLVIKYLFAFLWYDDVNVLISHVRVWLKGCSQAITIDVMTMTTQGAILLWPKLSDDWKR